MIVGIVIWRYFAVGLNLAGAIGAQSHVIGRIYFRREIIPLAACTAGLIDLAIGTAVLLVVAVAQGLGQGPALVLLPLVYMSLVLYTAAIGVVVSVVSVFARDLVHAMPTVTQLLFLATPIMYSPAQIPDGLLFMVKLNPIARLVAAARDIVLRSIAPSPWELVAHLGASATLVVLAIAYARSIEHRIVDIA